LLLILGLLILSTTSFGQYNEALKELKVEKIQYRRAAWQMLSVSTFAYSVAGTGLINPWVYPDTKSHVIMMGTFGVGFNILSIAKFAKARKTQKQIDRFQFDNNPQFLNEVKLIKWMN